jgi:hypothetical protein
MGYRVTERVKRNTTCPFTNTSSDDNVEKVRREMD